MRLEKVLNSSLSVWLQIKDAKILEGIFAWRASACHMQTASHVDRRGRREKEQGKKQSGRVRGGDQAGEGERKGRKKGRNWDDEDKRAHYQNLSQIICPHSVSRCLLLHPQRMPCKCFHLIFQLPQGLQLSASVCVLWTKKTPYLQDPIFAIQWWVHVMPVV